MKIVFSTPDWNISGVNSFNHNLMRGLLRRGHDVELLLIPGREKVLPQLPTDVPVKILAFDTSKGHFGARWSALTTYLNAAAPCIYVPGYDFNHSCVAPCLAEGVGIVGVVHSDDPFHYEHLIRLGRYWNAAVAVSDFLYRRMIELEPEVQPRSATIHYGVPCPATPPARPETERPEIERQGSERPLRIVYAGRFSEEQKRVSDLPRVAHMLADCGIAAEWLLIGDGPENKSLRAGFDGLPAHSSVRFTGRLAADAVLDHYAESDVLILTSSYEGLPLSLLEAMARGVIPVVTAVESGIPEVIREGINGFTVPIGGIEQFVARISQLANDLELRRQMHQAAFATIAEGPFSIDAVTERYTALFERVQQDIRNGAYRRPRPYRPGSRTGDILPPPSLQFAPDMFYRIEGILRMLGPLKTPIRGLGRAYYRRMTNRNRSPGAAPPTMKP